MEIVDKNLKTVTMALAHFLFCPHSNSSKTEQKECAELLSDIYDEVGESE